MSYEATQEKYQDLKRIGLTGQGLKKGSRIIPLLLMLTALLVFVGNLGDSKPLSPLHELMGMTFTKESEAKRAPIKPTQDEVARVHLKSAQDRLAEGNDDDAKKAFLQALEQDPAIARQIANIWYKAHVARGEKQIAEQARLTADRSRHIAHQRRLSLEWRQMLAEEDKLDDKNMTKAEARQKMSVLRRESVNAGTLAAAAKKAADEAETRAETYFDMAKTPHLALLTDERMKLRNARPMAEQVADNFALGKAELRKSIQKIGSDFDAITRSSLTTVLWLVLYALIPGLAGLIYRRAFWTWFLIALAILVALNATGILGTIGTAKSNGSEGLYAIVASQLLLLLVAFRLRRHSTDNTREPLLKPLLHNSLLAAALAIVGLAYFANAYLDWPLPGLSAAGAWLGKLVPQQVSDVVDQLDLIPDGPHLPAWEIILIGLPTLYMLFKKRVVWDSHEPKNIVVCLDGTWNTPGMTDFGHLTQTNVYKLFKALKEDDPKDDRIAQARQRYFSTHFDASAAKRYGDKQVALYYSGVGNKLENSEIGQLLGGATGLGASGIVERAYLDVMRVCRPGDRVTIFGFSRGAAIARLLARAIDQRGAPTKMWTLRVLGRHWVLWKPTKNSYNVPIEVLGCWDTVGSFGVAKTIAGINFQQANMFKDLSVPDNVLQAYHMVALDETRDSFEPTLMEPNPVHPERIVEVWFAGNHSNVGGGYATDQLSDVTLDFLLKHISSGYAHADGMKPGDESRGIYLSAFKKGLAGSEIWAKSITVVDPDPRGKLRPSVGKMYKHAARKLPLHAVISDTVYQRMRDALPVYVPESLFALNAALVAQREKVVTEVDRLLATGALDKNEHKRILDWSADKLTLAKWISDGLAANAPPAPAASTIAVVLEDRDLQPAAA